MKLSSIIILSLLLIPKSFAKDVWITIDQDAAFNVEKSFVGTSIVKQSDGLVTLQIGEHWLEWLSEYMHSKYKRCGGYMVHEQLEGALKELDNSWLRKATKDLEFVDYSIRNRDIVAPAMNEVTASNIASTIKKLSSYKNRYYQSPTGVESSKWIKKTWEDLANGRNDITVSEFKHSWKQPSVIMSIQGSELPNEIVIVGGHADSIAGFFGRANARAPGADDNASGIASITEAARVVIESGFRPKRTIQFMAYAAEEVGLRGSKEIASRYKSQGKEVLGVIQLDMTNFKGTKDLDIVMMNDYTNRAQNEFLGQLIDEYIKVPWGYSKCGYACSDHASWHSNGFPASMPFESTKRDMNGRIHTGADTLANSVSDASHAVHFSKLAVAFVVELSIP